MSLQALPNALTILRLLSVPVTIWLIAEDRMAVAFWLFIGAGVTDALDGLLARLCDARTALGSYLDPLADKTLLVSIYVVLGIGGDLAAWLVILVILRDVLIMAGAVTQFMGGAPRMQPLFISKVNTTAQIVLAALVLARLGGILPKDMPLVGLDLIDWATWLVAAATVASGVTYLIVWNRRLPSGAAVPLNRGD